MQRADSKSKLASYSNWNWQALGSVRDPASVKWRGPHVPPHTRALPIIHVHPYSHTPYIYMKERVKGGAHPQAKGHQGVRREDSPGASEDTQSFHPGFRLLFCTNVNIISSAQCAIFCTHRLRKHSDCHYHQLPFSGRRQAVSRAQDTHGLRDWHLPRGPECSPSFQYPQ